MPSGEVKSAFTPNTNPPDPLSAHLRKATLAIHRVGEPSRHHIADMGLFGGLGESRLRHHEVNVVYLL